MAHAGRSLVMSWGLRHRAVKPSIRGRREVVEYAWQTIAIFDEGRLDDRVCKTPRGIDTVENSNANQVDQILLNKVRISLRNLLCYKKAYIREARCSVQEVYLNCSCRH